MPKSRVSQLFGDSVRCRRAESGLSQEKLAERAGLHPTYISMIERGVRNPTLDAAARIAEALKVPLPQLIEESLSQGKQGKRKERK